MEVFICIWIIGTLFTLGLGTAFNKTPDSNWLVWAAIVFVMFFVWPILLGSIVGNSVNEN